MISCQNPPSHRTRRAPPNLSFASIGREGNTGEPPKLPESPASESSVVSSRHSGSRDLLRVGDQISCPLFDERFACMPRGRRSRNSGLARLQWTTKMPATASAPCGLDDYCSSFPLGIAPVRISSERRRSSHRTKPLSEIQRNEFALPRPWVPASVYV